MKHDDASWILRAVALCALATIGCAAMGLADGTRARELHRHACESGDARACGNLGELLLASGAAGSESDRAFALLFQACAGGSGRHCAAIGRAYVTGTALPHSPSTAASFFEDACAHGDAASCLEAADLFERRIVVSQPGKALGLVAVACTLGNRRACERASAETR
jgi:TPR repeat protein